MWVYLIPRPWMEVWLSYDFDSVFFLTSELTKLDVKFYFFIFLTFILTLINTFHSHMHVIKIKIKRWSVPSIQVFFTYILQCAENTELCSYNALVVLVHYCGLMSLPGSCLDYILPQRSDLWHDLVRRKDLPYTASLADMHTNIHLPQSTQQQSWSAGQAAGSAGCSSTV